MSWSTRGPETEDVGYGGGYEDNGGGTKVPEWSFYQEDNFKKRRIRVMSLIRPGHRTKPMVETKILREPELDTQGAADRNL